MRKKLKTLLFASFLVINSCDFRTEVNNVPNQNNSKFVVTWQDNDGTILDSEYYNEGDLPTYKKEIQDKVDDINHLVYQFDTWTPEIKEVDENIIYTASYKKQPSLFSYELSSDESYFILSRVSDATINYTTLEIPSAYESKPVKEIGKYAFRGCKKITNIIIPETIEKIDEYAFQGTQVSSITIPDTVKEIGSNAFKDCLNLKKVVLPSDLEVIANNTFSGCSILDTITYGESESKDIESLNGHYELPTNLNSIGEGAFLNCYLLKEIDIPKNITKIPASLFKGCYKLDTLNVSENANLSSIGERAFANTSLTSFNVASSIIDIGDYAFYKCNNLSAVSFEASTDTNNLKIGDCAFKNCENLTSFGSDNNRVSSYGKGAFKNCSSLTSFDINDNITIIDDDMFCNCTKLTTINFNKQSGTNIVGYNIHTIGVRAFYNCGFTSFTIPGNLQKLDDEAFANCKSVVTFNYPGTDYVEGKEVFRGCNKVTSLRIASNITSITKSDMAGNTNLTSISLPNSIVSISSDAFDDCPNLNYYTYNNCNYLGNSTNNYLALISFNPSDSFGSNSNNYVNIHTSCKVIANSAFEGYTNKSFSVYIPPSVTYLGKETFANSSVERVNIYSNNTSITSFDDKLFYNSAIKAVDGIPFELTSIADSAFAKCPNLNSLTFSSDPTNFSIYDQNVIKKGNTICCITNSSYLSMVSSDFLSGVTKIGPYACSYRVGTEATIPGNITEIGEYAFENCTNLNELKLGSSESPCSLTSVKTSAFVGCEVALTIQYYNSDLNKYLNIVYEDENAMPCNVNKDNRFIFSNYSNNTTLDFSSSTSGITKINKYAFRGIKNITNIYLSKNIETISENAFYYCEGLESIEIIDDSGNYNSKIKKIEKNSFAYCSNLTTVGVANKKDNDDLKVSISIFKNIETIGDYAFRNCSQLTSDFAFVGIKSIGQGSFYECSKLDRMKFEVKSSLTIGNQAFSTCVLLHHIFIIMLRSRTFTININSNAFDSTNRTTKIYVGCVSNTLNDSSGNYTFVKDGQSLGVNNGNNYQIYNYSSTSKSGYWAYQTSSFSKYEVLQDKDIIEW